jgi:hypothetical protein
MDDFTSHIIVIFYKIQGLTTLMARQQVELDVFIGFFIDDIRVTGPLTFESIQDLDPTTHVYNWHYVVSLSNVLEFLVGIVSWVEGIINEADEVKQNELWGNVGLVFAWLVKASTQSNSSTMQQQSIRQFVRTIVGSTTQVGQDNDI